MAFCTNCGQQVADSAKFCANCGTPISQNVANTERKTVFDGEIHKCPHCGEVLKAFETVCPTCKFEIRGAKGSNAVKELAEKLENASSEKQRIIIIKNFPIPNTKEDIFEFMLLASSNFDASYYATHLHEEDISDAWLSKVEQCYEKAKLTFTNQNDLDNIKRIYERIISDAESCKIAEEKKIAQKEKHEIKKEKQKRNKDRNAVITGLCCMFVPIIIINIMWFVFGGGINTNPDAIKVGISYEDVEGQYYEDVIEIFEKNGFTNIEAREDGWHLLHKSGTVKSVTIDGKEEFYSFSKFSKDAKIIILYYK